MKTLKFDNQKAVKLIEDKGVLVTAGRKVSSEIEKLEKKIEGFNDEERKYTEAVEPKDLIAKGEALIAQMTELEKQIGPIAEEIERLKVAGIPETVLKRHHAMRDEKEALERDRNKIALKVQKIKDKLIPILKKLVIPHLDEYDDIETAVVEKGQVVIRTYSHLEVWQKKFADRKKAMEPVAPEPESDTLKQ